MGIRAGGPIALESKDLIQLGMDFLLLRVGQAEKRGRRWICVLQLFSLSLRSPASGRVLALLVQAKERVDFKIKGKVMNRSYFRPSQIQSNVGQNHEP